MPTLLKEVFKAEESAVESKRSLQFSSCLQALCQSAVLLGLPCTYDGEYKHLSNLRDAMQQANALHADGSWNIFEDEMLLAWQTENPDLLNTTAGKPAFSVLTCSSSATDKPSRAGSFVHWRRSRSSVAPR